MLVAYERINDEPRSVAHYREALLKRLDEETGYLYTIEEKDLIPPGEKSGLAVMMEEAQKEDSVLGENLKKRAEKEKKKAEEKRAQAVEKAKAAMEKAGLNPGELMPLLPPPAPEMPAINPTNLDPEALMKFMKDAEADALARKDKAMADAMARKEQA
jgi:hypothetical protein